MFSFRVFLSHVFEPPSILIIVLGILSIKRELRVITLSLAILVYLSSTYLGVRLLGKPLQVSLGDWRGCDVIVVLGADNYGYELSGDGLKRVYRAYILWKTLRTPIILSGGKMYRISGARAMAFNLKLMGIPQRYMILEEGSLNTMDNARLTVRLIRRLGFRKPCLVTSYYHLKRAVLTFKIYGQEVIPVPAGSFPSPRYPEDLYPDVDALALSAKFLHEYLGLMYYNLLVKFYRK